MAMTMTGAVPSPTSATPVMVVTVIVTTAVWVTTEVTMTVTMATVVTQTHRMR